MNTAQEWEQEFDLLYNNINSNVAPALDAYEKSVFLTMAQEQVVSTLYSGGALGNDSFETTEKLRRSLNILLKEAMISVNTRMQAGTIVYEKGSLGGFIYTLPTDVQYIVYEMLGKPGANFLSEKIVIPTTHDEIYKTLNNPFKSYNETRALRLDVGDNKVEIIGGTELNVYNVRYLRKPQPIILVDLTGTSDYINGLQTQSLCELDEVLHRTILAQAVQLAVQAQNT